MDCRVVVEAAVPVYDVGTADEAIRIAISKTGEMLNPDLNYVEIDLGTRTSPAGESLEPAFVVASEALVALELEMTVYNVERDEHASRIARKEIGQRMTDIPLDVLGVYPIADEDDANDEDPETNEATRTEATDDRSTDDRDTDDRDTNGGSNGSNRGTAAASGSGTDGDDSDTDPTGDDEDILPEFEDLLDET